jgi:general secretion pathway protein K
MASEPVRDCLPVSARAYRNHGFALLIVLWTLVLIAFVVAQVTASGRTETRIAENLVDNAIARAAADGALSEAIFNLSNPRQSERWPLDDKPRELLVGDSHVTLRLENEASWINPNLASPALMQALLLSLGFNPQIAQSLAAAIAQWVGTAEDPLSPAAVLAAYRAAGLDYQPPGAPLESLGELGRVVGMTADMLAALRPHLSLYAPAEPSPAGSDPIVQVALAVVAQSANGLAAVDPTPPDIVTTRITAVAAGPGKASVQRVAIVRLGAALANGYTVLFRGDRVD